MRAKVNLDLEGKYPHFYYDQGKKAWCSWYTVIFSEHNGVSANITSIVTKMFEDDIMCASITKDGGFLPSLGRLEVDCYIEVPNLFEFNKMIIKAYGWDKNGFRIVVSIWFRFIWIWSNGMTVYAR